MSPSDHPSQDDRVREAQQLVVDVARSIAGSLDHVSVAKTVVDAAVHIVGSDRCAVYLLNEDRTVLDPLWAIDVVDPTSVEHVFFPRPVPIDALPLLRYGLTHHEPVVIRDTEQHPLSNPDVLRSFNTRSVISIPLRGADQQVFGFMPFAWVGEPREIGDDDVFLARSLAALAEVALSNAILFAKMERERRRATALSDMTRAINSGRDLGDTLMRAINSLVDHLRADEGAIWLASMDGESITGAVETRPHGLTRIGARLSIPGAPNIKRAIDQAAPLVVPVGEALGEECKWFESLGLELSLFVPLMSQGRFVGMAFVNFLESSAQVNADDLQFAAALADQAALAIERARLVEEASTRASELEAIISQMGEGIIITDREGRIVLVNDYAAELHGAVHLGVTPDQHAETYGLFRPDGTPYPSMELPLSRAALHGERVPHAEWRIRRPDGTELYASGSATPIRNADGAQLGAVLVMRDVTARRQLEAEKDHFLSIVSHELKTPLTTIKGLNDLARRRMLRGFDQDSMLRSMEGVASQVRRMEALIADMLDVGRLITGTLPFKSEPLDFAELVRDACERAQAMTESHCIELRIDSSEPMLIVGDALRLEQVLDNLLTNAIKYSPDGGPIHLALRCENEQATLLVRDHGIGIPEAGRERLFERFYRGANVRDSEYGGLGIGLALSREIIRRHGGSLVLEETSASGSTFKVTLPLDICAKHES